MTDDKLGAGGRPRRRSKSAPAANASEMMSAGLSFAIDARAATAIAARYELTPLERLVVVRISQRTADFLADHLPAGDKHENE